MAILEARDLAICIGNKPIIEKLDVSIPNGKITAILGPNGSGKSTLLKAMARILRPVRGSVCFNGSDIAKIDGKELARQLALLPQSPQSPPDLTVRDLVEHGRFPHRSWWKGLTADDEAIVNWALGQTGMSQMAGRLVSTLSGGERQRAWIAMALAQQPQVLLLDEPTTYLDICHQLEIMQLVAKLNRENGITVVMVLHDINHAAQYSDYIAVLKQGRVFRAGSPGDVVTAPMLREVFQVESEILLDANGKPVFLVKGLSGDLPEQY